MLKRRKGKNSNDVEEGQLEVTSEFQKSFKFCAALYSLVTLNWQFREE